MTPVDQGPFSLARSVMNDELQFASSLKANAPANLRGIHNICRAKLTKVFPERPSPVIMRDICNHTSKGANEMTVLVCRSSNFVASPARKETNFRRSVP
jgi:hypothetical protein